MCCLGEVKLELECFARIDSNLLWFSSSCTEMRWQSSFILAIISCVCLQGECVRSLTRWVSRKTRAFYFYRFSAMCLRSRLVFSMFSCLINSASSCSRSTFYSIIRSWYYLIADSSSSMRYCCSYMRLLDCSTEWISRCTQQASSLNWLALLPAPSILELNSWFLLRSAYNYF